MLFNIMKLENIFIVAFIGVCAVGRAAFGMDVGRDMYISSGQSVHDDINITATVTIVNQGDFTGRINVASGRTLYIQNSGQMSADIIASDTARVVQIINSNSDLNFIGDVNKNFEIVVQNDFADAISLSELAEIANGADSITVTDSALLVDSAIDSGAFENLKLHGNTVFYVDNSADLVDGFVLNNIDASTNGVVQVLGTDNNSLYRVNAQIRGGSLYVDIVRDTDYAKVLNNGAGLFLNELRAANPNDRLIAAVDRAASVDEINSVLSQSARMTPMLLMDSVRAMDSVMMARLPQRTATLSVAPLAVMSNNMDAFGVAIDKVYNVGHDFTFGISGYVVSMDYADNFDEYKSALYGGNVHIAYFGDLIFARALAGVTVADFNIGPVFDGYDTVTDPLGLSMYLISDVGVNFDLSSDIVLTPFVRVGADWVKITNATDTDFIIGGGANIMFDVNGDFDLEYKYGATVSADARGIVNADVQMQVASPMDGIGGNISVGFIYDDAVGAGVKFGLGFGMGF